MIDVKNPVMAQAFLDAFSKQMKRGGPHREFKITEIKNDGDRVLLLGESEGFVVITTLDAVRENSLEVGDVIEHDNFGSNFGFLVRVVRR